MHGIDVLAKALCRSADPDDWPSFRDDARAIVERLAVAGYRIELDQAALLAKGNESGIALTAACTHEHWNFNEHGRRCTCGASMLDAGD